ncbi:cupredoxin domain-containing protein [Nitrosopumilus sp.]|uniref:cupredoxin domain-containing protein n=1 Tax=Nitrosopumilus sp. TaxID=2024843 RepID=UPI003B5CBDA9
MKKAILLFSLFVFAIGYFVDESYAEISENQAFILEGSGFAVTEDFIEISEIDMGLLSQQQRGSTINFMIEDGFVTLADEEFVISDLEGKFLREGRYIRINGNVEGPTGFDTTISFFGRLVDESKDAAVYGFTGRINTPDESFKIIYTTKLSNLSQIDVTQTSEKLEDITIHILRGSSTQGLINSYIDASSIREQTSSTEIPSDLSRLRYFSSDRISVEPGTTITIMNNDVVSHSILSGKENYGDRHNPFTADGRISTGEIISGKTANITFEDAGFYRLYDPDYPWMRIVAYVFPDSDKLVLGQGKNFGN